MYEGEEQLSILFAALKKRIAEVSNSQTTDVLELVELK